MIQGSGLRKSLECGFLYHFYWAALWESGGSPRDTDGLRREMRAGRELRWERLPGLWVPEERCVILRGSKGSLDYRRSFPQPGKWNLPAVEL